MRTFARRIYRLITGNYAQTATIGANAWILEESGISDMCI